MGLEVNGQHEKGVELLMREILDVHDENRMPELWCGTLRAQHRLPVGNVASNLCKHLNRTVTDYVDRREVSC